MNPTQKAIIALGGTPEVYADPYPGLSDDAELTRHCGRCGGSGFLDAYRRINGGVCYSCDGVRSSWTEAVKVARVRERSRINNRNLALLKKLKQGLEADALRAEFDAANPGLRENLSRVADEWFNRFALDLVDQLAQQGTLTANQIEAGQKLVDDFNAEVARKATTPAVEPGKYEVSGEIVKAQWVQSGPRWNRSSVLKVTLLDDRGFKVYGTLPAGVHELAAKDANSTHYPSTFIGARVAFTAEISPSDTDDTFGFARRPSKARVIARAE